MKDNKKTSDYLTIKESRAIIKYNVKQMKYYEAQKRRKLAPAEYTAEMDDENNVVEIDDLHTRFLYRPRNSQIRQRRIFRDT